MATLKHTELKPGFYLAKHKFNAVVSVHVNTANYITIEPVQVGIPLTDIDALENFEFIPLPLDFELWDILTEYAQRKGGE